MSKKTPPKTSKKAGQKVSGKASQKTKSQASKKIAVPTTVKPSNIKDFSKKELLAYYRTMLEVRRFEERAAQLYGMGLIGGFCHLYIGQEAVITGLEAVRKPQDTAVTQYRDHGHMIAMEMSPGGVMAELTGRIDGYSRGKGGSMHMFSREKGFFGGHGIVGASVPIGTGMAFAHKYNEDNGVCFTYMGDGAANQGQVFESMNMAKLWDLPVLYIIENNEYAMGTSVERHAAGGDKMYNRGAAFEIPGMAVDGMDVLAVKQAAEEIVDFVRTNSTPFVLEVKTYRYRGHSMSDPANYRTKDEVDSYKNDNDPIINLQRMLLKGNIAKETELKKIDDEVKAIMKDAVEYAKNSPEPDPSELWTDVLLEA